MSLSLATEKPLKPSGGGALQEAIVSQFKRPHGFFGGVAGWIMANRRSNIERNRWTVELLNLAEGANVLEIGCGPGIGLRAALEARQSTLVTGLDHSGLMIETARKRLLRDFGEDRLNFWRGTIEDLAVEGKFDAVFSCNVLQFVENRKHLFDHVKGHMKPAGFFATTYQPRGPCASAEAGRDWIGCFAEDLCEAGFVDVDIREQAFGALPAFCAVAASSA